MEFRTIVDIPNHPGLISHWSRILLLGSCFSDNIGQRLQQRLFAVRINPFGTLYNPASIRVCTERLAEGRGFTEADLIFHDRLFHSFDCHTSHSDTDAGRMLRRLNETVESNHRRLAGTDTAILTFGTAWVYTLASDGTIVANCHKLPAATFRRRLMDVEECERNISSAIQNLRSVSPGIRVILTVSPVRHLSDSAHGNQISKSTLLMAVDRVVRQMPDTIYFPAYEIMMDDLRDYRFYDADMCHPSATAADYIYSRMAEAFFDKPTAELSRQCEKLTRRMLHRPMTADTEAIARFREETDRQIDNLLARAPYMSEAIDIISQK